MRDGITVDRSMVNQYCTVGISLPVSLLKEADRARDLVTCSKFICRCIEACIQKGGEGKWQ
jgi:hypothetical protein